MPLFHVPNLQFPPILTPSSHSSWPLLSAIQVIGPAVILLSRCSCYPIPTVLQSYRPHRTSMSIVLSFTHQLLPRSRFVFQARLPVSITSVVSKSTVVHPVVLFSPRHVIKVFSHVR